MAFPSLPVNNQRYKDYIYNSDITAWLKYSLPSDITVPPVALNMANGISGFNIYNNASGAIPSTGTGGVPTSGLTFTQTTTAPLFGEASGLFTKPASNCQGQGVSYDFTLDTGMLGDSITIKFFYQVASGTFVDNDIGIYIYDIVNSVLIYPSTTNIVGANGSIVEYSAQFAPSTSTSYRIIFHIQNTTATAWTWKIDNIVIGNQKTIQGAAIGNWNNYIPAITATSAPSKGTIVLDLARWRRVGDSIEVFYDYEQSGVGGIGSGTYYFSLPSGLTIPTNAYESIIGEATVSSAASEIDASSAIGIIKVDTLGRIYISVVNPTSTTTILSNIGATFFNLSSPILRYHLHYTVPISQWTSNINLVTDFQEYAFNTQSTINTNDTTSFGYGSNGTPILANTSLTYYDVQFIKPIQPSDIPRIEVRSKVDGSWASVEDVFIPSLFCFLKSQIYSAVGSSALVIPTGVMYAKLNANIIRIYFSSLIIGSTAFSSGGEADHTWAQVIAATDGYDRWRVRKISNGNSTEVISTTIRAEYTMSTTVTASTTPQNLNFNTLVEDTNMAVTTGASWKFTAPVSGIYAVTMWSITYSDNAPAPTKVLTEIYHTGVSTGKLLIAVSFPAGLGGKNNGHNEIRLNAGEYIQLYLYTNSSTLAGCRFGMGITRISN